MKKLLFVLMLVVSAASFGQTFPVNNLVVNGTSSFAGASSFSLRPTFSGNTPWDTGNFNPLGYALLSGATFTGPVFISNTATSGTTFTVSDPANNSQGAQIALLGNGGSNPNKYIRALNGTFAVVNNAQTSNLMTLVDNTGQAIFPANVTAASFTGTVNGPLGSPLSIGSSLYPNITSAITTTATSTSGSSTINVTSPTGLTVGMGIYSSFVSSCSTANAAFQGTTITNIAGTTVTMSCPATATNGSPVSVQFGQNRYDATSSLLTNDIGTQTLKVGAVSQGNSAAWLDQVSTGQDFRFTSALQVVPPVGGGYGITVGARTSDATGGAAAFPLQSILYADTWGNTSYGIENVYLQDNLAAATAGKAVHIQMEQSINSLWGSPPGEDPYTTNQVNQTIAHRYDCGTGQSGPPFPNGCTTAIEIVTNPQNFQNGLVIANGAIDTGGGTRMGNAISVPIQNGILWWSGAGTYSASLNSPSASIMQSQVNSSGGQHQFYVGGTEQFAIINGATYQRPVSFSSVSGLCSGPNEGFAASITDSTTASFNAVVTGGGTNHVAIRCNGTNWVVY